jgi:hypothetical protein
MAITILSEAPDVGLVKNKMLYKVQTDSYLTQAGVEGVYTLTVVDVPVNGDSFKMFSNDNSIANTFTFVDPAIASADTTGTLIRDDQATVGNVATVIMLKMNQNPLVTSYYTVTNPSSGVVRFEAKKKGQKYGLNGILVQYLAPSFPFVEWETVTAAADDVYNGNFYIVTQVFVYNNATEEFDLLSEIISKPNKDQSVDLNVASVLKASVDDYHLPSIGQSSETRLSKIVKAYKLVFCEKTYAGFGLLQPASQVQDKQAWFAGFSEENFADYPDPITDWFGNGKRDLSWFPNNREVREDEEHFFSFINYDTSSDGGAGI